MQKFVDAIGNLVKLINSLLMVVVLGAVVFGGLWAYRTAAEFTSKPIQMPDVKLPAIEVPPVKVALPEVQLPEVKLPDVFGPKEPPPADEFWNMKGPKSNGDSGGFWGMDLKK